jgi:hypothetical protein
MVAFTSLRTIRWCKYLIKEKKTGIANDVESNWNTRSKSGRDPIVNRILMTAAYFGRWPNWFPAYIASCAANKEIDWLFLTDCEIPENPYPNIRYAAMTLADLNQRATETLKVPVRKDVYSQCDIRPAYGLILEEFFQGYEFWGHTDVDIIWGDIKTFISDEILDKNSIVSSRKNTFSGHFTLYKNVDSINNLFRKHVEWKNFVENETYHCFDEKRMGQLIRTISEDGKWDDHKIYWPSELVLNWQELNHNHYGWNWNNGRLLDGKKQEHMYIHFMTWKNRMTQIDFQLDNLPNSFQISHLGIWGQRPNFWTQCRFRFPLRMKVESFLRKARWKFQDYLISRSAKKRTEILDEILKNELNSTTESHKS